MNNEYLVMRKYLVFALCSLFFVPMYSAKRKVHTIGDSTMSEYKPMATPKRGWGMYLQAFCNADSLEINNRGKSGASTRTFYETENLWSKPDTRFTQIVTSMLTGKYIAMCEGDDYWTDPHKFSPLHRRQGQGGCS